jgi:hypothetical protein
VGYLYVSCVKEDQAFVDHLLQDLRQAGVELWLANEKVMPGVNWNDSIRQGIKGADGLIYVASRNSGIRAYIITELGVAIANSIPVFPLAIDNDLPTNIARSILRRTPLFDFRMDYAAAFQSLLAALPPAVRRNQPQIPATPKSKGYIFISYAQEDTDFVNRLRNFLKDRGYGYWDYQDSERNYRTQLPAELEGIMLGASATICVLSPAWKNSKWTQREYAFCDEIDTPVFLVKALEMGPTLAIAGKLYIDFIGDEQAGFAKLDHELRRTGLI